MKVSLNIKSGLWHLLNHNRHLIYKARQRELDRYGILINDSVVLFQILKLGEDATTSEISRQLFRERHSVSEQLIRMEKRGLIKRLRDPAKKNSICAKITKKGYEVYCDASRHESTEYIMSALTKEEQLQFWFLLSKVRDKAIELLGIKNLTPYPPSDPSEL